MIRLQKYFILSIILISVILAANVTIDDADATWTYLPPTSWNAYSASVPCTGCTGQPDTLRTYAQTWHEANASQASAVVSFHGVGVRVFGVCASGSKNHTFFIDDVSAGVYLSDPCPAGAFQYDLLLYIAKGLPLKDHTLKVVNQVYYYGDQVLSSSLVVDYLIYDDGLSTNSSSSSPSSTGNSSTSSRPSVPPAAIIVPIVVVAAALIALIFWRRRRQAILAATSGAPLSSPQPHLLPGSSADARASSLDAGSAYPFAHAPEMQQLTLPSPLPPPPASVGDHGDEVPPPPYSLLDNP